MHAQDRPPARGRPACSTISDAAKYTSAIRCSTPGSAAFPDAAIRRRRTRCRSICPNSPMPRPQQKQHDGAPRRSAIDRGRDRRALAVLPQRIRQRRADDEQEERKNEIRRRPAVPRRRAPAAQYMCLHEPGLLTRIIAEDRQRRERRRATAAAGLVAAAVRRPWGIRRKRRAAVMNVRKSVLA